MLVHCPWQLIRACAETKHDDIVAAFKAFTLREDISVILITQTVRGHKATGGQRMRRRDAVRCARIACSTPILTGHGIRMAACRCRCLARPNRFLFLPQIAADIRYILNAYDKVIPTVLEIPSKDKPYHEEQDPIMQRVLKLMGSRD